MQKILFVLLVLWSAQTQADDVEPLLDSARAAIQSQDYAGARMDLQDALQKVERLQVQALIPTFPMPLPGWKAEKPPEATQSGGVAGISIEQTASQGEANVKSTLTLDNPMVGMMAGMLNSPMITGQPGVERVRIGRENAVLTWRDSEHSGDVSFLLGGRVLLKVEGTGLTDKQTLLDYAKGWKINEIKKVSGI